MLRVWPLGKLEPQYQGASHKSGRGRPNADFNPYTASGAVTMDAAISSASKRRRAASKTTTASTEAGTRNPADPVQVTALKKPVID